MSERAIKNLIFDLGGVILDLSVPATLDSFARLSGLDRGRVEDLFYANPGFLKYEKGLLSDADFRDFVREVYSVQATDAQLDASWNAMLVGIPLAKLQLLSRLMNQYRVFLLSNTNNIHLEYINHKILPGVTGGTSLDPFFHKTYYSHVMKKRKPDAEIFEQVLQENNLRPEETLFLDDHPKNIEGAAAVGIQTLHVVTPDLWLTHFHEQ
jgi:putative hydrolase of the HAD superfamily